MQQIWEKVIHVDTLEQIPEVLKKHDIFPATELDHAEKIALLADKNIKNKAYKYRTLSDEQQKLLIKGSISASPLRDALILLNTIDSEKTIFHSYERLAFAKQLVFAKKRMLLRLFHFG